MPKSRKIYLDYASSALPKEANPGAIHALGVQERRKLENAREAVAGVLNARRDEIVFTSGATESNNLAILGLMHPLRNSERDGVMLPHIVTTNIEHASVLEVCKYLDITKQAKVTYVPVERNGLVDPEKIKKALTANTVLVTVGYANNEIGTIQPIREIGKVIRRWNKNLTPTLSSRGEGAERQVRLHTDAAQAAGYLSLNVEELGVDLLSLNSAKIYGPKGVGALYVKRRTPLKPIMFGGSQEFSLRPGTENVGDILKFSLALESAQKIKEKEGKRLAKLRDYFFLELQKMSKTVFDIELMINGDLERRLPNNVNITIPNIQSDLLVIELSARGIMASAKSACHAGSSKASHVIGAIHPEIREVDLSRRSNAEADGSLRFSLGRETAKKDIDYTVKALAEILAKLKKWYLQPENFAKT